MKKIYALLATLILFIFPIVLSAQIGVTVTNPTNTTPNLAGTYTSLATALTDLNAVTAMTGPVVLTLDAGTTETAPATGLTIGSTSLNAVLSATNKVTIIKAAGAATVLNAGVGTATPASAVQDGILKIVGADYITIDGLSLTDGNTTNPATMEYGIGLFKLSATDGAGHNTIQNCVITLSRVNNAAGSGVSLTGSRGINVVNATALAQTVALTVTAASGTNSSNKFYTNNIENANIGIALVGYAAASPYTNADVSNDAGGGSAIRGNSILNFGGGGTNNAYGIYTLAQYGVNLSFNNINNNNGSGVTHTGPIWAVLLDVATDANATVSNNSISLKSLAAGSTAINVIENKSGGTGTTNSIKINSNTFSDCSFLTQTTGAYHCIHNSATANTLTISSNKINPVTLNTTTPGSGQIALIYQSALIVTLTTINSNIFTDQSWSTSGDGYLIYDSNNTDNISIANNSTSGNCGKTVSGGTFYGYYNFGSPAFGTATLTGNNFSKITVTGATAFYGIYLATLTNQIEKIINNTITNITTGTGNSIGIHHNYGAVGSEVTGNNVSVFTGDGIITGITLGTNTASLGLSVSGNRVFNLSTTGTTVNGISYGTGAFTAAYTNIFKNKIYTIQTTNIAGVASGIRIGGGTTLTIYNNLVGDIKAPSSALPNAIIGLNIAGGVASTTINAYYNTIHLNGTSTAAGFGSSAVFASITPAVNLRNNIFSDNSTPMSPGIAVAYRRSSPTLGSYASTSDNNLFYGGTPGAAHLIFYDGTNSDLTLATYKARVSPRDVAAVTELPPFLSLVGANGNFLHISTVIATQVESGAINIAPINDDYDANFRQGDPSYTGTGTAPDIGADENNFILKDLTAPVISNIVFTSSSCAPGTRTLTATITDASGVNNAAFKPRIYFRKNGAAYFSTQAVLTSGTATNGTWTFTIDYSLFVIPGIAVADVIDYFIVSQDVAAVPNPSGNPSAGLVLTDVNTVTTPPTTPLTYTIANALSGLYTVGVGQSYTTLTAAITAYNTACLTGAVIFELTDANYNAGTGEIFPIVINANADANATNTLTIRPAATKTPLISGSTATAIIQFNGADYVTIDGSNNASASRNLTITNTSTSAVNSVLWVNYTAALDAATHNTIKNTIVTGNAPTTTLYGIFSGDNSAPDFYGLAANNSNTYQNNAISNAFIGVGDGGPSTMETGIIIANNSISNIGFQGIWASNHTGISITNNTIEAISSNNANSSDPTSGIIVDGLINGGSISRNTIHNIVNTNGVQWASYGITLQSTTTNTGMIVSNNMLYDIYGVGDAGFSADNGHGIALTNGGGYKIYYNSVNMATNQSGGSGIRAAIYIKSAIATNSLDVRNNIFVAGQVSGTTGITYGIYCVATSSVFTTINYNNYWNASGANVGYLGGARATIGAWRTATGGDLNSVSLNPQFSGAANLHMNIASSPMDALATPIAGITIDYDVDTRNSTTPDIGADEFTLDPCTSAVGGTASANGNSSLCGSGVPTITATGYSLGLLSGYQWQSSTDNFGSVITDIVGQTNPAALTVGAISSLTYYRLKVTCPSGTALAYSNTLTITVNNPSVSSPVNGTRCGTGTVNISATPAGGATTMNWYAASTGGLSLFTGNTFTTPVLTAGVTTYYAAASVGGLTEAGGKPSSPGSDGATLFTETGIVFDATQNLNIISTVVYPSGTGTVTFALYDNGGTELLSTGAIALSGSGTSTPVTVPLGFNVSVGTGYRILVKSFTGFGTGGLLRDFTGNVFPYNSPSGALSVTGGYISGASGTYYFLYNLIVSTGCESARTAVTATVTAAAAITPLATPASICEGDATVLSVSSANPNYNYTWTPAGPGSVSPTITTTYSVNAVDPGPGPTTGCTAVATIIVNVSPKPSAVTVTPATPNICGSGTASIAATGGSFAGTATANSGVISVLVPDNNSIGNSTALAISTIPVGATIDSVIVSFNITHDYDNEMVIDLEAPNGQILNLVSGQSVAFGGDNFFNTRISSDNSFPNIGSGTAPFTGTYQADAATTFTVAPAALPTTTTWAPLFGTPNGNWTLRVNDDAGGDLGTITNYTIKIAYTSPATFTWLPASYLNVTTGPNVISSTPATQLYTVTATNPAGCKSTKDVTVNVVSNPVDVTIAAVPSTAICPGTPVTFTATPTNGGTSPGYTWKIGATTVYTGIGVAFATYNNLGTLVNGDVVTCTLTSSGLPCTINNPKVSNSITMVVNPSTPTSVSVTASPAGAICAGTSVTFTAAPTNGGTTPTYEWFIGGVSQGAASSAAGAEIFTPAPLTNGQSITCRMVSNATNCPSPSATVTSTAIVMSVSALSPVSVSLAANPGTAVCSTTPVTFTATATNAGPSPVYTFYYNGVIIQSGASNVYGPVSSFTDLDSIRCVLTSSLSSGVPGCATGNPATSTTLIMSVTTQPAYVSLNINSVCPGSSKTFTATPTNGGASPTYQFYVNGLPVPGPAGITNPYVYSPLAGDIIKVEMTSSLSCALPKPADTTIVQGFFVTPSSTITGSNPICPGIPVLLTSGAAAGSGTIASIQWRLNYANIGGATNATYLATAAGVYKVTVTNSNGCVDTSSATFTLNAAASLMAGPYTIGAVTATATAGSSGTTINVASTANLVAGALVTVISGTGTFVANTIITTIIGGTSFSVDKIPTTLPTAGAIIAGQTCTNYINFATAIADLNSRAISAPCIFNVGAGYAETLTAGTPQLQLGSNTAPNLNGTMTGNSITFQKSGVGANPVINAYIGTATPVSGVPDGIWSFRGIDNVTVDGIDLKDNNTTNPATMEFGFGLFKLGTPAVDGCQNITIKNSSITLNKVNNAAAGSLMVEGSTAIVVMNATNQAANTALTPTTAAGANSSNKIYNNSIQNCNYGIAFRGFAATVGAVPFLGDISNDVGGASIATTNSISNYGGSGGNTAAGIRATNQWGINLSFNTITSSAHAGTLKGIWGEAGTSANATINDNTITVNGGLNTGSVVAIDNAIGATASANTVSISNNTITGTHALMTSGTFTGIINAATAATVNINGNKVDNVVLPATSTGAFTGISNTVVPATLTLNNNRVQGNTLPGTGTFLGISNAGAIPTSLSINTNLVNNNIKSGTGTMNLIAAGAPAVGSAVSISTNTLTNNTITAGAATTTLNCIIQTGGSTYTVNGNTISNNSITAMSGTGFVATIHGYVNQGGAQSETVTNNIINNLFVTGTSTGIHVIRGIYNNTSGTSTRTVSGNTIYNLYTDAASSATIIGIHSQAGGNVTPITVSKNYVYDLFPGQNGVTASIARGLYFSSASAGSANVTNNVIALDLSRAATSTGSIAGTSVLISNDAVRGIDVAPAGAGTLNFYYNSVNLTGGGITTFGSAAIFQSNVTATIELKDNIFSNKMTSAGTGKAVAYKRAGAATTTYATTSNYNSFYAGTPSTSNYLYYDGTTGYQDIAAYSTAVTREANSNDLPTTFTSSINLLPTSANCANESKGNNTGTSVTTDYTNAARTPIPVTDIGAYEFSGTVSSTLAVSSAITSCSTVDLTAASVTTGSTATLFRYYTDAAATILYATPTAATTGTYYIRGFSGSCPSTPAISPAISVTVNPGGTWLGVNTVWTNTANWCSGIVPTNATNVFIPSSVSNYPVIPSGTPAAALNVTIATGASITTTGTGSLEIKGTFTNTGNLLNWGEVKLTGTTAQTFPGTTGTIGAMTNLTIVNTSGATPAVTIDRDLLIRGTLTPTTGIVNLNNIYLTLRSVFDSTARIGVVGSSFTYTGTGNFVVERYYPSRRTWRLLTAPVVVPNSRTIFSSWQAGGNNTITGNGTYVTGPAPNQPVNGLDASPLNKTSLQRFNYLTGGFVAIGNTKLARVSGFPAGAVASLTDTMGYFVFIRGDRTAANVDAFNSTGFVTTTTLRDTGNVKTGTFTYNCNPVTTLNNNFTLIGNPYASPVDFTAITKNGVANKFWAWDPNVGTGTVGGYVYLDFTLTGLPVKSPMTSVGTSVQNKYIQSSQAILVETSVAGSPTLVFNEANKGAYTDNNLAIFRPARETVATIASNIFVTQEGRDKLADGAVTQFDEHFNNEIDVLDGVKFSNVNETFSVLSHGNYLSLERRHLLTENDTLFYWFNKSAARNYKFNVFIQSFTQPNLTGFLEDSYLHSSTPINMDGDTWTDFSINSEPASAIKNRFRIVFKKLIQYTSIKGYVSNNDIAVDWSIANEQNINHYEIERSADGNSFEPAGTQIAGNTARAYSWLDINPPAGTYYYRVKCIGNNGAMAYSEIVKVVVNKKGHGMYVFPNPATDNRIGLQMNTMPAGMYTIRLLNSAGQIITNETILHTGGTVSRVITPKYSLINGAYQLEVTGPDMKKTMLKVIVQTK